MGKILFRQAPGGFPGSGRGGGGGEGGLDLKKIFKKMRRFFQGHVKIMNKNDAVCR